MTFIVNSACYGNQEYVFGCIILDVLQLFFTKTEEKENSLKSNLSTWYNVIYFKCLMTMLIVISKGIALNFVTLILKSAI